MRNHMSLKINGHFWMTQWFQVTLAFSLHRTLTNKEEFHEDKILSPLYSSVSEIGAEVTGSPRGSKHPILSSPNSDCRRRSTTWLYCISTQFKKSMEFSQIKLNHATWRDYFKEWLCIFLCNTNIWFLIIGMVKTFYIVCVCALLIIYDIFCTYSV